MANTTITNKLIVPAVPALPLGPVDYNRQYQDQLNNVLRLYFKQLNGAVATFFAEAGGRFVSIPCGTFFSNVAQNTTANTVTIMTLNNTDANATVATQLSNGSIRLDNPGIYNYQFSAQFFNTASQDHDVFVWIRVDGTDVYESATQVTVPSRHGSIDGAAVAAWNFLITAGSNTVVDLIWTTNNPEVFLGYAPAQSSPYVRPSIPSLISTVTFVSRLPT